MATLTVLAKKEEIYRLQDLLHEQLEAALCSPATILQLEMVVEEAFVNIASYAYDQEGGTARFDCEVEQEERLVTLRFVDHGKHFNPLLKKDPDLKQKLEDRKIGGFGVYLIKKTMDQCEYAYLDGENILTLRKKF